MNSVNKTLKKFTESHARKPVFLFEGNPVVNRKDYEETKKPAIQVAQRTA